MRKKRSVTKGVDKTATHIFYVYRYKIEGVIKRDKKEINERNFMSTRMQEGIITVKIPVRHPA